MQEYYEKLCKKFPEITFNTGSSLMSGNENKVVIKLILSILVDTFISKISFPMQPGPEIGSISDA